ncbi:PREDICTED: uncharacterized protein LOC106820551 [Priapulus caudatus]|uniref:Uncharacterized protein LOC106820551 n=1 Tax=Priapulus caudatus TaxID=37621 RepID=A0ABM1F7X7_PRICU|nr:PREDICTED: uncharacterized protein LOC106820551 [Priapulus caudatus]
MSRGMEDSPSKSPLSPKRGGFVYARTQRYMQAIKNTVTPKHHPSREKPRHASGSQTPESSASESSQSRGGEKQANASSLPRGVAAADGYVIHKSSNSSSLSNIFKKLSPKFRRTKKGDKIVSIYDDTRRQSNSSFEGYESDSALEKSHKQTAAASSKQTFVPARPAAAVSRETPSPQLTLSSPESGPPRGSGSFERPSSETPRRPAAQSPGSNRRSADLKPPASLSLRTNLTRLTRQPTDDSIGACSLNVGGATSSESLNSSQAGPRRAFMDTSIITIGSCSLNVDATSGDLSTKEGERSSASQRSLISDDRITTTISEAEETMSKAAAAGAPAGVAGAPAGDHGGRDGMEDARHQPSYVGISCLVSGYPRKAYTPMHEQTDRINSRAIEEGRKTPTRFRSPMRPSPAAVASPEQNGGALSPDSGTNYVRSRVSRYQSDARSPPDVWERANDVAAATRGGRSAAGRHVATADARSEAAGVSDVKKSPAPVKPRRLVSPTKVVIELDGGAAVRPVVTPVGDVPTSPSHAKQSPSFNKLAQFIEGRDGAAAKTASPGGAAPKPTLPRKPAHLTSPVVSPAKPLPDFPVALVNDVFENGNSPGASPTSNHNQENGFQNGDINIKDGHYFLKVADDETMRIRALCTAFESELNERETCLPEDASGKVRAATGKASLLINKRFKQFIGLCNQNISQDADTPFPTTAEDLAGFWDMVLLQVHDVNNLFAELKRLRTAGWVMSSPVHAATPSAKSPAGTKTRLKSKAAAGQSKAKSREAAEKAREQARRRLAHAKREARKRTPSGSDTVEFFVSEK